MTGAGMAGLTYFANNEDDPYITLKDPVRTILLNRSCTHCCQYPRFFFVTSTIPAINS